MLALALGCTVEELGKRMSAREFSEWKVVFAREQLHPAFGRLRHGQQIAATFQGPSRRRGGQNWTPKDFVAEDVWAPTPGPAAPTFANSAIGMSQFARQRRRSH